MVRTPACQRILGLGKMQSQRAGFTTVVGESENWHTSKESDFCKLVTDLSQSAVDMCQMTGLHVSKTKCASSPDLFIFEVSILSNNLE